MLKKGPFYFTILFFIGWIHPLYGQSGGKISSTFTDTSMVFLGFDLSHAKILDQKKVGMQSYPALQAIHKYLCKVISVKKISRLTEINNVRLDFRPTDSINSITDSTNVITTGQQLINKDSIQAYINRYEIEPFNGPAAVILFEYFGRKTKTTAAYLVRIDMPSKKVTRIDYIKSVDGNSYGKLTDWNYAAYIATVRLFNHMAHEEKNELNLAKANGDVIESSNLKDYYKKLPVAFTVGPALGLSSSLLSGGAMADVDIYHILVGGRFLMHPVIEFLSRETIIEKSIYMGYRFREKKEMVSVAVGFGKVSYSCHQDGYYCENYKRETISTFPVYIAYEYFPEPNVGFGISMNLSTNSRSTQFAILAGLKLGIAWSGK